MEIPWESLDKEVLDRLIEDVVTRDGTDYGASEMSRVQKMKQVEAALRSKRAVIYWDIDNESASIQEK